MSEHKFEPFDRVLVRGVTGIWLPDLYGCKDEGVHPEKHLCTGGISYADIVPYTPETAHLLGTTQPYEPPKPPHEYKWGDRVEVMRNGEWVEGFFVFYNEDSNPPYAIVPQNSYACEWYDASAIRPLEVANE